MLGHRRHRRPADGGAGARARRTAAGAVRGRRRQEQPPGAAGGHGPGTVPATAARLRPPLRHRRGAARRSTRGRRPGTASSGSLRSAVAAWTPCSAPWRRIPLARTADSPSTAPLINRRIVRRSSGCIRANRCSIGCAPSCCRGTRTKPGAGPSSWIRTRRRRTSSTSRGCRWCEGRPSVDRAGRETTRGGGRAAGEEPRFETVEGHRAGGSRASRRSRVA